MGNHHLASSPIHCSVVSSDVSDVSWQSGLQSAFVCYKLAMLLGERGRLVKPKIVLGAAEPQRASERWEQDPNPNRRVSGGPEYLNA